MTGTSRMTTAQAIVRFLDNQYVSMDGVETKFVEVSQNQPEYTEENIKGTIVGIWTPEMFHGVSVAGYHLHFISEDFTFGGHVLDFIIDNGTVEIGAIDQLNQSFPVQDRKFLFADLDIEALKKDIDVAE